MGSAVVKQESITFIQKAILALESQCFKFSRSAYLMIASGYPLQSVVLVRSLHERLATAVYMRTKPDLAEQFVKRETSRSDMPKYATALREGALTLLDDFFKLRYADVQVVSTLKNVGSQLSKFYSMLSNYSHPNEDTNPSLFREVDYQGREIVWIQYEPQPDVMPYAAMTTGCLLALQVFLEMLLQLDLRDKSNDMWEDFAMGFDTLLMVHSEAVKDIAQEITEKHLDS